MKHPVSHQQARPHSTRHIALRVAVTAMALGTLLAWLVIVPGYKDLSVPVKWDAPQGWMVVGTPPEALRVTVSGPRVLLFGLENRSITFSPCGQPPQEGLLRALVTAQCMSGLPWGVRLASSNPATVRFRVERELDKITPVVVELAGEPALGYTVTEIRAEPVRVALAGPRSTMAKLDMIRTVPVEISGAKEKIVREIPLALPKSVLRKGKSGPVRVDISIEPKTSIRELKKIPITGINAKKGYVIRPGFITLSVWGSQEAMDSLSVANDVKVYIDLEGLAPGIYARAARIQIPLALTLLDAEPEVFTVRVQ